MQQVGAHGREVGSRKGGEEKVGLEGATLAGLVCLNVRLVKSSSGGWARATHRGDARAWSCHLRRCGAEAQS